MNTTNKDYSGILENWGKGELKILQERKGMCSFNKELRNVGPLGSKTNVRRHKDLLSKFEGEIVL